MKNMNSDAIEAMDSLFSFAEAMDKGVTLGDLAEVMRMAISSGHDMLATQLSMATIALERSRNPFELLATH